VLALTGHFKPKRHDRMVLFQFVSLLLHSNVKVHLPVPLRAVGIVTRYRNTTTVGKINMPAVAPVRVQRLLIRQSRINKKATHLKIVLRLFIEDGLLIILTF